MSVKNALLRFLLTHPNHTVADYARISGTNKSSVSSAAAGLRTDGLMLPSDGSGKMTLTTAGIEAARALLPQEPVKVGGPVCDAADFAGDSPLTVAQGEVDRLQKELGEVQHEKSALLAELHALSKRLGCHTDSTSRISAIQSLQNEVAVYQDAHKKAQERGDRLELELGQAQLRAAERDTLIEVEQQRRQLANAGPHVEALDGPVARLEWSAWENDDGPLCARLLVHFGGFWTYIAEITSDHGFTAKLFYSDAMDGESLQIKGFDLAKVSIILAQNIAAAGLTMPPVPPIPVKA